MMLHGVVVFAFQGAAWYAVWALRKRAWTGLVAAGWFVFAAALGATLPSHWFVLLASAGLFLLMVVPGWVMVRTAARAGISSPADDQSAAGRVPWRTRSRSITILPKCA